MTVMLCAHMVTTLSCIYILSCLRFCLVVTMCVHNIILIGKRVHRYDRYLILYGGYVECVYMTSLGLDSLSIDMTYLNFLGYNMLLPILCI